MQAPVAPPTALALTHDRGLCWAAEHCGIPWIRGGTVTNPTEQELLGATVHLQLAPDLGEGLAVALPPLGPGETHELGRVDYPLPPGRLRQVVERERVTLQASLVFQDRVLAQHQSTLDLLPCHQWPGLSLPPGLLATFITPNHPTVARILKAVSERLREAGGTGSIPGYQGRNPALVRAQTLALFEVLQALDLSYIGMPASFEHTGQKVRLPDMILRDRMANCLDYTLLAAACLEQMGLRPLVVLIEGHAFPGVWLLEERFPEGVVEDAARLRNLLALGQLLPWDSSTSMDHPRPDFAQAQAVAEQHLAHDEPFQWALDVRVMRMERFLPLPIRETTPEATVQERDALRAPNRDLEILLAEAHAGPAPDLPGGTQAPRAGRWQHWKDRLLDLSLRNRLLNHRPGSALALPLEVPDVARFEDLLAEHAVFELLPRPPQDSRDERDRRLLAQREDAAGWRTQRLADLEGRVVHCSATPADFLKRAKDLETVARVDLEEGGVHTVFASLGLLRWQDPADDKARLAPLLLYPVQVRFDRQLRRVCLQRVPEDPLPNVTLVEKMRRDFAVDLGFLAALDSDGSGLDMPQLFRRCREAIQRIPRWEILEDVHLGHFTFAKFLMWKDLEDNADRLLENPIVRHLVLEDAPFGADQPGAVAPETLDHQPPGDLPCVMDADATQLSAIASALAGRSFVLQGPPGTGKSQTIANLIACALARHRRVLFVSEKMAALEVVHARLRQAGLEDFCLELHSHKANRKAVIASLQKGLDRTTRVALTDWETRASELQQARAELNHYAEAIHRVHPIGFSLFQGSSRAYELRHHRSLELALPDLATLSAEDFRQRLREVDTFAHRAALQETEGDEAWRGTDPDPWTHGHQEALTRELAQAQGALAGLQEQLDTLARTLGQAMPQSPEGLQALDQALEILASQPLPQAALDPAHWDPLQAQLQAFQTDQSALAVREERLGTRWSSDLLSQDLQTLHGLYQQHAATFPLFRWFLLWGASRRLKPFLRIKGLTPLAVLEDLGEARAIQAERQRIADRGAILSRALAPAPWDHRMNLPEAVANLHVTGRILQPHLAAQPPWPLFQAFWQLPDTQRQGLQGAFHQAFLASQQATSLLIERLRPATSPDNLTRLGEALSRWQRALSTFRTWCFYRETARLLASAGLAPLVQAQAEGLTPSDLVSVAERSLLERWCAAIRDAEPALRGFEGSHHHRKVSLFRELDRHWIELGQRFVLRQLESRLPAPSSAVSETSEMGILLRETRRKIGHMAIRKLLKSLPTLMPRLKPCLLMSPLSVAQYLPAEDAPFDLLVFDEASQITTHDAIGALARGAQVVVVGDSRQLPPTRFFTRNLDEDAEPDDNDVVELESILDEAVAKQLPQQLLGWHYRSRHHTLIEFSNQAYYENRLHVFPAAARKVPDLGMAWHPVPDGVYHSSGCEPRSLERTNPIEAQRLVACLVDTLRHTPASRRTFGVVTFSTAQQRLIQDLLDEQRERFPEIEPHFQSEEPVFVKNLENVQGDERDEILFSIGYARDQKGRMRMHFGPLSVSGGERRLNVAITRARSQLRVFSTLTHDQIDLSRSSARGAEDLKAFLKFVERHGGETHSEQTSPRQTGPFEQAVAEAVEAMGFDVHRQIGCGGYRIDLAVVDPDHPGRYLLGVECDGSAYHSAPAARDRDRLRHDVLTRLGWSLHRIWFPDWLEAEPRERQRLATALETARKKAPEPRLDHPYPPLPPMAEALPTAEPPSGYGAEPKPFPPYEECALPPFQAEDPEQFYDSRNQARTCEAILRILADEAPLHPEGLFGRIVRAWGWSALTRRGRTHLEALVDRLRADQTLRVHEGFLWRKDQMPEAYTGIRTAGAQGPREAEHIAPQEIANAMQVVLQANISLDEEALLKETARLLGYRRVTTRTQEGLRRGLAALSRKPQVNCEGTRWKQA